MTPRPGRTALYRIRGESYRLLYVGITNSVPIRWNQHMQFQPWWNELRSLTVDWYDTREEAEKAEIAAIRAELPKYNKAHAVQQMRPAAPPRPLTVPHAYAEIDGWRSDDGLIAIADLATYMSTPPHVMDRLTQRGQAPQSITGTGLDRRYRPVDVKLWMAGNLRQSARDPVSDNPVTGPCVTAGDLAPAVSALGFGRVIFDSSTPEGRDEIWNAYMACRDFLGKHLTTTLAGSATSRRGAA